MKTIADYIKHIQISEDGGDGSSVTGEDIPTNTISSGAIATREVPLLGKKIDKRLDPPVQEQAPGAGKDDTNQHDNELLAGNVGKFPLTGVGSKIQDPAVTSVDSDEDKKKLFQQKQQYQNDQISSYA